MKTITLQKRGLNYLLVSTFVLFGFQAFAQGELFDDPIGMTCETLRFEAENTGANMTLFITEESILGSPIEDKDQMGVFFLNDDDAYICAGVLEWNNQAAVLVAWGDDQTTAEKDGFSPGDHMYWFAITEDEENVFEINVVYLQGGPFYETNSISAVDVLTYSTCSIGQIEGCVNDTAVNFNPEANYGDDSCDFPLFISSSLVHPTCVGDNGSVELSIEGGLPPYAIEDMGYDLENLAAGTYNFVVSDDFGLTEIVSVEIITALAVNVNMSYDELSFMISSVTDGVSPTYQWYFNGYTLDEETEYEVDAFEYGNGLYTLIVTNADGCEGVTEIQAYGVGVEELFNDSFTLYPMPTANDLNISYELQNSASVNVKIINVEGKIIDKHQFSLIQGQGNVSIDVSNISNGFYTIEISDEFTKSYYPSMIYR